MKRRRPGLQKKWGHVVNSLQEIIPSYERASSRISMFADRRMRIESAGFAVRKGSLVLDLGAGPGTMSRLVASSGGEPVLVDVSRAMLLASDFPNRIQAAFESLPFRGGVFDGIVSGFALRDAFDLRVAMAQLSSVLKPDGRFGFCDLGKPDSTVAALVIGAYLRVAPILIGLISAGKAGLRYGSIYDTYVLAPHNSDLATPLSEHFGEVVLHETQLGGSIVAECVK